VALQQQQLETASQQSAGDAGKATAHSHKSSPATKQTLSEPADDGL